MKIRMGLEMNHKIRIKNILRKIYFLAVYIKNYMRCFHKFGAVGIGSEIKKTMRVEGGKNIEIGKYCFIMDGLRIETIEVWGGGGEKKKKKLLKEKRSKADKNVMIQLQRT